MSLSCTAAPAFTRCSARDGISVVIPFPAVYSVLDELPGVSEYYLELASDYDLSDLLSVHVSVKDAGCSEAAISAELQARLRVSPKVLIESEEAVRAKVYAEGARKLVRLIDRRDNNNEQL